MARVRKGWQVTLPREVRRSLDLHEGSELLFIPTGPGEWKIKVLPPRIPIPELLARFAGEGSAPDLDALREEIGRDLARQYLTREGDV